MAKRKPKKKGGEFTNELVTRMARHATAESLNENIITHKPVGLRLVLRTNNMNVLSGIAKSAFWTASVYRLSFPIVARPGPDGTTIKAPCLR